MAEPDAEPDLRSGVAAPVRPIITPTTIADVEAVLALAMEAAPVPLPPAENPGGGPDAGAQAFVVTPEDAYLQEAWDQHSAWKRESLAEQVARAFGFAGVEDAIEQHAAQTLRECTLPPRPVYRDVDEHLYDSDGDLIGAPLYDPWLRPGDDDDSAAPAPTAARAPGGAWRVSPADDSAAPALGERLRREEEEDRPWLPMPTGGGGGAHSGAPGLPGLVQCRFCRMDPPDHLGRDCPSRALGGAAPAPGKAPPPGAYAKAQPPPAYAEPHTRRRRLRSPEPRPSVWWFTRHNWAPR